MNDFMKLIYAIFIGAAITIFTSITVSVAYPGPSFPQPSFTGEPTEQQLKEEEEKYRQFEQENAYYISKKTKIILGVAIVVFALGVIFRKTKMLDDVVSEGMLFGGFFTSAYSVTQGFPYMYSVVDQQNDKWVTVAAALLALIMVITIAQFKFAPSKTKKTTRKKK